MTKRMKYSVVAAVAILLAATCAVNGSTINGVANQIISGLTQYAVLVGGGTGDIGVVSPSATSGYALLSNGSSANPGFAQMPNAGLTNSSITFASSGCITASGAVSLGGTLTLTNTCTGFVGVTNASPGATPTWVLANGDATWTLSIAVTSATVTVATGDKFVPHTIQICQGATAYAFPQTAWPSNVKGGFLPAQTINKCSVQSFESYDGVNLYATNPGLLGQ